MQIQEISEILKHINQGSNHEEDMDTLYTQEDLFRIVMENMGDVICLHDPETTRYELVPPSMEKILGFSVAELLQMTPYDLFHPDTIKWLESDHNKKAMGSRQSELVEVKCRHKNGSYVWFEVFSRPLFDKSGKVCYIMSISRDISERKYLAEEQHEKEIIKTRLMSSVAYMEKKMDLMVKLEKIILEVPPKPRSEIRNVLNVIRKVLETEDDWEDFKTHFHFTDPGFVEYISMQYPSLTNKELKHIALIRLGFDNSDVARFMSVKKNSLRVMRNRLKQKLQLNPEENLLEFIKNLDTA
ncbi:hypothetical protein GCM10009122_57640 [Fulvivirga kasyanovii]|uniref:histidine kinase n=1 Tax=Fulvivirga kasyanovii TaxID=396812 RepID=A0ABW9RI40_9BACT|nr:PAS domain S-box protein [Fulvivirga kasyanovii]MTI23724.1 PAS domain S-box protein [Fulvivirga kasyanovii]